MVIKKSFVISSFLSTYATKLKNSYRVKYTEIITTAI